MPRAVNIEDLVCSIFILGAGPGRGCQQSAILPKSFRLSRVLKLWRFGQQHGLA